MRPAKAHHPGASGRAVPAGPGLLASVFRWSREVPARAAITPYSDDGRPLRSWSYQDLAVAALAASSEVRRRLGPDETAILRAFNSAEMAAWVLGCLHAGVRLCLLNPAAPDRELQSVAARINARAVIGVRPAAGLTHLPLERARPEAPPEISPADRRGYGSVILQSSGTTGSIKHPRRSEAALDADAHGLSLAAGLDCRDRVLIAVPLSHSYGIDLLVSAMVSGASLHVCERFDVACVERLVREGGITVLPGVPFMFEALGRSAGPGKVARPGRLRLAFSAGSLLPASVQSRLQSAWGMPIIQLYGASELGTVTFGPTDDPCPEAGCIGSPVAGVSIRVLSTEDPAGILPCGSEGELAFRAPSMLDEYVDAPLLLEDGHFRTGDLGRVDARGRVHMTGRLRHLIDVGGLKVNPIEVEHVFGEHPAIRDCALIPLRLSETVVKLRLVFVPANGARPTAEDLRAFARERLAPHKLPRVFDPVPALPRSMTGKLLRHQIDNA